MTNAERPLGAGPDGNFSVGIPVSGRSVRFDVALVDGRSVEFSFDDDVRFLEAFGNVAFFDDKVFGDVCVFRRVV